MTGPLWFGWLLGLAVIVVPGLPAAVYAIGAVGLALAVWIAGRPLPPASVERNSANLFLLGLGAGFVALLAFNSLAYPPRDHDILISDLFARHLSQGWDFWALPRYTADERGFYYPLSHPPAIMALQAWFYRFGPSEWLLRLPSTYLLVGLFGGLAASARRFNVAAGVWALLLTFSAALFLQFVTSNSQDVYRHAALAAAVAAFCLSEKRSPGTAAFTGALLGLAATIHSLEAPFVVLLPLAYVAARRFDRSSWLEGGAMAAAGILVGCYPYLGSLVYVGKPLIPTTSIHDIPEVSHYLHQVMTIYGDFPADWGVVTLRRLRFLLPEQAGWIGIAYLSALGVAALSPKLVEKQRARWFALALSSGLFVLLVFDPANHVLAVTHTSFWSNLRYPQTVYPLIVTVAAAVAGALASKLRTAGRLLAPLALAAAVYPHSARFDVEAKLNPEPLQGCVLCSDGEKLAVDQGSAAYRGVRWLEDDGRWACLTFREAEYFDWSRKLVGAPYYSQAGEGALAAGSSEAVIAGLAQAGLNCVVAPVFGALRTVLDQNNPALTSVSTRVDVLRLPFYDVELWLFNAGPLNWSRPISLDAPTAPSQSIDFPLSGGTLFSFSGSVSAPAPVVAVAFSRGPEGFARLLYRENLTGTFLFAFTAPRSDRTLHFWFSAPVTLAASEIRALNPADLRPLQVRRARR